MGFTSFYALVGAALLTNGALATDSHHQQLQSRQAGGNPCTDVHIFLSRGNNEPYPGRQGTLVEAICKGRGSCDYEDIQFNNPLDSPYCIAVEDGTAAGLRQINAYNKRCPKSKLILSGYSQGAQVIGDILGGGGGSFWNNECTQKTTQGLDPNSPAGKQIAAALTFGDVRHTASRSWNSLSGADKNGQAPRTPGQLAALEAYADVLRDFCDATDPICAKGDTVANHLNYFDKYTDVAADWVKTKIPINAALASTSMSTSTTSAAASTSSSTSTKVTSTFEKVTSTKPTSTEAQKQTSEALSTATEKVPAVSSSVLDSTAAPSKAEATTAASQSSSTAGSSTSEKAAKTDESAAAALNVGMGVGALCLVVSLLL